MSAPSEQEMKAAQEAMAKDQEEKKAIVIETITKHCDDSPFGDLQAISDALEAGDKLTGKAISGGKTNFSYRVWLEGSPDNALFAKICFRYALWNPDRSVDYDLERVENEFKLMNRFREMMGDGAPVVTPYLCVDISDSLKLLVTQWSPADEQWANQFIDGEVDERLVPQAAKAFATLNCAEADPMFNDNVRPCMRSVFPVVKMVTGEIIAMPETKDQCAAFLKELGEERFDALMEGMDASYMKREVLCHSDSHMFNCLVEKKPSTEKLEKFGEKGSLVICDWEMAYCGPSGRDPGIHQMWPIACAIAHAAQGRKEVAYNMMDYCHAFWEEYANNLEAKARDKVSMTKTFRDSLGWAGFFLLAGIYVMGLFQDVLPLEGVAEDARVQGLGAIGIVGIKFMQWAFGGKEPDLTLEELRQGFKDTVGTEIEALAKLSAGRQLRPRRLSVLRRQGRRVSDASLYDEAARRFSVDPRGSRRVSVFDVGNLGSLFNEDAEDRMD